MHFFSGTFSKVGCKTDRADPAAETLTQKKTDQQGSNKNGESCGVDGVKFCAEKKPLYTHQCTEREKCFNCGGSCNKAIDGGVLGP